jgi:CheY-like chemotaxis protein/HPt (histidine-containing phosphotransfer) domain-containing protein
MDVRAVTEDVLLMLADKAQSKSVELASFLPNDLPPLVWGDPHRLRQVLTNLVGNAVKFTEKGEVVVRVSDDHQDAEHHWLTFKIEDTGIGISAEVRQKLFQAFTQADGSTTRKFGGTGLGLAISKRLVELMGGDIGVDSAVGKGSTFWFTVACKKHAGKPGMPATDSTHDLAGLRVLVVDDNKTNRDILHYQVTSWGMRNGEAAAGSEALEILKREAAAKRPYDIVILDMQMPGMDGLTLARAISADSKIRRTRLVMMTSLGNTIELRTLKSAGIVRCLTKPVRQSDLYNCLVSVLESPVVAPIAPAPMIRECRPEPAARRKKSPQRLRILMAEDNKTNQEVTQFQLEKLGYRAEVVSNGRQAVEAHAAKPYDLILMDCQMPELDGYAAAREIRRREAGERHTPIIALTANALEGNREKCLLEGMDDYVSKPITISDLKAAIERALSDKPADAPPSQGALAPGKPVELQVVNMAYLREMTDHDEEGMRRLVGVYLGETARELDSLQNALNHHDADEVQRIAHGCKGASAAYGMTIIAAILKDIEFQGYGRRLEKTSESLRQARDAFANITNFWNSYLSGSSDQKAA